MRRLLLLTVVASFAMGSCDNKMIGGDIRNTEAYFIVQDTEGNDLLNPNTPGHIDESGIKASYVDPRSGLMLYHSFGFVLNPDGILSPSFGGQIYLTQFLIAEYTYNSNRTEAYSTNYIHWDETTADKLKCTYRIEGGYFGISEIVINDQLKWNESSGTGPFFKIVVDGDQRTISLINPTEYLHKTE